MIEEMEVLMSADLTDLDTIREDVIARGQRIYDEELRNELEREHFGRFVAIEPESGRYFLGETSAEAAGAAHDAMPENRFYLARIGYRAAHTIGTSHAFGRG